MLKIEAVSISPPPTNSAFASAEIEFLFDSGDTLRIADLRVLKNSTGSLWVGMPTRVIGGAYQQLVFASHYISRLIEDAVIPTYEQWAANNAQSSQHSNSPQRQINGNVR